MCFPLQIALLRKNVRFIARYGLWDYFLFPGSEPCILGFALASLATKHQYGS